MFPAAAVMTPQVRLKITVRAAPYLRYVDCAMLPFLTQFTILAAVEG
jgi:hypothetical protein